MEVNKIDLLKNDEFIDLIKNSSCVADVLRSLNYSVRGNSWAYKLVKDKMKILGVLFGKNFVCEEQDRFVKLPLKDVLVENSNYNRQSIKKRLIKEGFKEQKCECCGLSEWNNKPIALLLHHKNGVHDDNRLENLLLLCPNCHSQTENWGTKGKKRIIKKEQQDLPVEDKKIIIDTVKKIGVEAAKKQLTYRPYLITRVVRQYKASIIMVEVDGTETSFFSQAEAAKYLKNKYGFGSRSGITKCVNGQLKSIRGIKFYRKEKEIV